MPVRSSGSLHSPRWRSPTCRLTLAAGALVATACDSSVGLDSQRKYFDSVMAPGMCRSSEDFSRFDVSVQILSNTREGTVSVLPDDRIAGETNTVEEVLKPDDFTFALPATAEGVDASKFQGFVEDSERPSDQEGIAMRGESLRFDWTGGEERRGDDRLVVLLVDHSGSLRGQPDPLSPIDPAAASDLNDQHITFLKGLVQAAYIPSDTYWSLVWFDNRLPAINPVFATPTRNTDVLVCPAGDEGAGCRGDEEQDGLSQLERDESGGTPLIDALDQTYNIVINGDKVRDLNPIVVLFTDGVENGDSSGSGKTFDQVLTKYANHEYGGVITSVPVVVLHLQPTLASGFTRGRDENLYRLACATGGEYIFIERADEFTSNNRLEPMVANRIFGTWKLTVLSTDTIRFDPGRYLLSTDLSLTLGREKVTIPLTQSADQTSGDDTRLWFVK